MNPDTKNPNQTPVTEKPAALLEGPKRPKVLKYSLLIVAAVLVILIVALAIIKIFQHKPLKKSVSTSNIAFVVNGLAYNVSQIKSLVSYPVANGYKAQFVAYQAYNMYKDAAAAGKLKIYIPNSQLTAEEKRLINTLPGKPGSASAKPWVDLLAYDNVLKTELDTGNTARPAQGYVFNFWFNQHEQTGPLAQNIAGNNDPSLIAQDKSYAQNQADTYYSKLKSNAITPAKLIDAINQDAKLNQGFETNVNGSMQFGNSTTETWQQQLSGNQNAINYINKQTKTGLSTVQTGQIAKVEIPTTASDYTDGYFYIVQLNALPSPTVTQTQFYKELISISAKYNKFTF